MRFPLFFTILLFRIVSLSLFLSLLLSHSQLPVFFLYRFPRFNRTVFHFLIEKVSLLSKDAGRSLNDYLRRKRDVANQTNRRERRQAKQIVRLSLAGVNSSKGKR